MCASCSWRDSDWSQEENFVSQGQLLEKYPQESGGVPNIEHLGFIWAILSRPFLLLTVFTAQLLKRKA